MVGVISTDVMLQIFHWKERFTETKNSQSSPEYPVTILGSGPQPWWFLAWILISYGTNVGVFLTTNEWRFTVCSFHSSSTSCRL